MMSVVSAPVKLPVFSRRALASAIYLLAIAGFAAGVWWFAFVAALDQLEERGQADLALAGDRITGQLQRYRELAVLLSDHPVLVAIVLSGNGDVSAANDLLQRMADKTGAAEVQLVNPDGMLAAARDENLSPGVNGAIERAMTGALGSSHFVDSAGHRRIAFAAPVFQDQGPARGAVIVMVDVSAIEWNWPTGPSAVFFRDADGVVFVTNRSDLVLTAPGGVGAHAFPDVETSRVSDHQLWTINGGRYLPNRALHLIRPFAVINMTGEILLDVRLARDVALLQAAVAGALCLVFGALLFVATERRRALSLRLAIEAAANMDLESRVKSRTGELSETNEHLQREVHERHEAEVALRRAQSDLVQAAKLSALGQMSAGISHELNQPLMAIRSFAENAEIYLERGNVQTTAANLSKISDLSRRMGRIIKNLRAFSRQEVEPIGNVDLAGVVDAVLELVQARIDETAADVVWNRPKNAMIVRGGEVRLQQVVMNLVTNALDAMAETSPKKLVIRAERRGGDIRLIVRDTGPGILEPGKMFDPFYSTKEVGQSEGMGLGLSISYGLVQSFGGAISGRNHPEGGAVFTVKLTAAWQEQAA